MYVKYRWCPPRYIREAPESKNDRIRKKWHILVEGENIPPPIKTFKVISDVITVHVHRNLAVMCTCSCINVHILMAFWESKSNPTDQLVVNESHTVYSRCTQSCVL